MRLALENSKNKYIKSGALTAGERMKASNFPANFLKIGTWEYTSQYEGDLVAKCYFAKHKLVWEVLDAGLKRKIEIQWSDITALKATCPENGIGTLDLVLNRPPIFFKETDPQPRKHTLWQAASDFTGGQASLNRRHILQCPSILLSKNFEKIIQCDERLNQLSHQPDTILLDPLVFGPRSKSSIFENPNESKSCQGLSDLEDEHEAPLPKYIDLVSTCDVPLISKKDVTVNQQPSFSQPVNLGASVVELQANVSQEHTNSWNQVRSLSIDGLLSHLGDCVTEQKTAEDDPSLPNSEASSHDLLKEITQHLLSDSQGTLASDEKRLMARVNSLSSLLEKDAVPATLPNSEPNDSSNIDSKNIDVIEVDSDGFDEEINKALDWETTTDSIQPPPLSRKDSYGDFLLNLPRIASIPQLFNIPEDFDNIPGHFDG
ncbi:hypothetical protein GUJ93_ZPchr0006g41454 [Zizania palustris]|uniref:TRF2/HOY1 PH-like domain-containing protein n=1 Tax=Zizania palustris TaxID=103762 RepID=A0A8J5TDE2_ZIZPA|nr:hypothetical protein GUJ93_ZPchr0006g41454 [Zizania palustris]